MAIESATYISDLVTTNPTGADAKSTADDHLRLIKSTVKATFPNVTGAVTPTHTQLNFVTGVTSAIQTQLDTKAPIASPTFTGTPAAPTAAPSTNSTQIATTAYVDSAAALLAPKASPTFTGAVTVPTPTNATDAATKGYADALAFSSVLPSQTGNAGKFVTTNGTAASWAYPQSLVYSARTSNTILSASDVGSLIDYTSGTFTQTLTAAATLGNGWYCWLKNSGTGVVTVDPNASETIGGVATAALNPGDIWVISSDGTNIQLERLAGMNFQIYTSGSGNFTVPAGVERIYVECWGAGGGITASAGGGGGGGYSAGWLNTVPGATLAYAVGAGSGSTGGNTTFAATFTANGGNTTGAGGTASGGTINITGGAGAFSGGLAVGGGSPLGAPSVASVATSGGGSPGGGASSISLATSNGGSGQIKLTWV